MPNVTAPTRNDQNGQSSTYFLDSVSTTSTTYTYPAQQDALTVTNKGNYPITLTVNGTPYTIQGGGVQSIPQLFTSFTIVATGQTAFDAMAISETTNNTQLSGSNVTLDTKDTGLDYNTKPTLLDTTTQPSYTELVFSQVAWIDEANPTTAQGTVAPNPMYIDTTGGSRKKALMKFDISTLTGKKIRHAYLRLVNGNVYNPNSTQKLQVNTCLRAWTTSATWNTFDGTTAWGTAGASNVLDVTGNAASQVNFRVVGWLPQWFIDVSDLVQKWADGSITNNGVTLTLDTGNLQIFKNSFDVGMEPTLVVIYSNAITGNGQLSNTVKLQNAVVASSQHYSAGAWSWTSAFNRNAQVVMDKLGWGYENFRSLKKFYDQYTDTSNGNFINGGAASDIYSTSLGEGLIYVYQKTNNANYSTSATTLRNLFGTTITQRNGIYTDAGGNILAELAYCGLSFLAAYSDAFNDTAASNLAVTQAILLYDTLLATNTDGVPTHLIQPNGTRVGKGWSRGMGWLFTGMAKLLRSPNVRAHANYPDLISRFKAFADVLKKYQYPNGMWRRTVHDNTSKFETSGTAMLALAYEIGVRQGVLDASYISIVNRAMNGLLTFTTTGVEMPECFPDNTFLDYTISTFSITEYSYGAWIELIANVYNR